MCERSHLSHTARPCSTSPESKDHNVQLRQRPSDMGLTLNEYGLFRLEGERASRGRGRRRESTTPSGFHGFPRNSARTVARIEAAEAGTLPEIIGGGQIRGDLHMHTRETTAGNRSKKWPGVPGTWI